MGLLVGTVFYPVISVSKRHRLITWGFKIVAIPLAVVLFVVLIRNFYTSDPYAGAFLLNYLGGCWLILRSLFGLPIPFMSPHCC